MANQTDPPLRDFLRGVVKMEASEMATGDEVARDEADNRIADAMVAKYGKRRRFSLLYVAAGSLAAAALVGALLIGRPWSLPSDIAKYGVTVRGDDRVLGRSDPGEELLLRKNSVLEIDLRPGQAVDGAVEVKSFVRQGESINKWTVSWEHKPKGTMLLRRRVAELQGLPSGKMELSFVIGRGPLPPDEKLVQVLGQPGATCGEGCQILKRSIEIVEP